MELAPVPRRRPWPSAVLAVLAVVVLLPVTLLSLVPGAFGLERYVIASDAADAGVSRGSVAFERRVPVGDLASGDVITYVRADPTLPVADAASGELVTRSVSRVDGDVVLVGPEDAARALSGMSTVSRVLVAVPLVGYPFLGPVDSRVAGAAVLLVGLVVGGTLLRGGSSAAPARAVRRISTTESAGRR